MRPTVHDAHLKHEAHVLHTISLVACHEALYFIFELLGLRAAGGEQSFPLHARLRAPMQML